MSTTIKPGIYINGVLFVVGTPSAVPTVDKDGMYLSIELSANETMIGDDFIDSMKAEFGGRVTG